MTWLDVCTHKQKVTDLGTCVCVCVCMCVCHFSIFINLFTYLFLAALGLRCCARAFSSCGKQGLLFVVVPGLLIAVTSLVVEHGL